MQPLKYSGIFRTNYLSALVSWSPGLAKYLFRLLNWNFSEPWWCAAKSPCSLFPLVSYSYEGRDGIQDPREGSRALLSAGREHLHRRDLQVLCQQQGACQLWGKNKKRHFFRTAIGPLFSAVNVGNTVHLPCPAHPPLLQWQCIEAVTTRWKQARSDIFKNKNKKQKGEQSPKSKCISPEQ